jgi:triacylglycerol lipase
MTNVTITDVRPTVVLVHGLARTRYSMAGLQRHLERAGYPTWARSYPSRRRTIAGAADEIAGWLARDLPAGQPLVAVTHSLGGVIIRHVAARVPFQQIVMLAPPSHGSRVSQAFHDRALYRWFFGPAGQELAAGDEARAWPPLSVPFAVIAGTRARALANPTSWLTGGGGYFADSQANDGTLAVDETALPGMTAFATVDASHTWIMNDQRVRSLVLQFLRTSAFVAGDAPAPRRDP